MNNWPFFNRIIWKKKKAVKKEKIESKKLEKEKKEENYDEIIGRLAAFFAHEIRNPLTSIIGFTQFLEQDKTVKTDPKISQYLSIIKDEALRMESLIQELLVLATTDFQKDHLSIIDVKCMVEKTVAIFEMQPEYESVRFETDLLDEVYITGNESRFEQLLVNLMNNAIEASKGECIIHTRLKKEDKDVWILITDNGTGIPEDLIEHLFSPFFTTKEAGTGVGLPICKAIVETLNGELSIQNQQPKGAQVQIRLPLMKNTP
ncbi:HAMP domain-containing histidine kinase [Lederbergia sp. NSJ-179]|uniref:sensor histidine kinase n=1 Tax=Lederbergia sp. NSJ-179 TaxID=2931402 RepID=UPI001FD1DDF5|nr:HAMP domain-containing sensor histidine kinase [Lederbergia sp. NSJ-179]MCJ7842448.1 HAMP domain-containing histidine kinase [Lederbergia sp. NSJ-179]